MRPLFLPMITAFLPIYISACVSSSRILLLAAKSAEPSVDLITAALQAHAIVNSSDEGESTTALMLVCETRGCGRVLDILLDNSEIDVNLKDQDGRTALHFACGYSGQVVAVERLLANGSCLLNEHEMVGGDTPLHWAAANGYVESVRLLTSAPGIDLNARNHIENTALHVAAFSGSIPVLQHLLAVGLDPLDENSFQQDSIHLALIHNHLVELEVLLEHVNRSSFDYERIGHHLARVYVQALRIGKRQCVVLVKHYLDISTNNRYNNTL